ncbi:hypothetical protein CBL_08136 [Carabus blaptoides fortunei]
MAKVKNIVLEKRFKQNDRQRWRRNARRTIINRFDSQQFKSFLCPCEITECRGKSNQLEIKACANNTFPLRADVEEMSWVSKKRMKEYDNYFGSWWILGNKCTSELSYHGD